MDGYSHTQWKKNLKIEKDLYVRKKLNCQKQYSMYTYMKTLKIT